MSETLAPANDDRPYIEVAHRTSHYRRYGPGEWHLLPPWSKTWRPVDVVPSAVIRLADERDSDAP